MGESKGNIKKISNLTHHFGNRQLAKSAGLSISISSTYIVIFTKMQKIATPKNEVCLSDIRKYSVFEIMLTFVLLRIVQQRTSQQSHSILKVFEAVVVAFGEPNLEFFIFCFGTDDEG